MKKISYTVFLIIFCFVQLQAQRITVGSYNIRYENQGDVEKGNGWAQRFPVICQQILFHDFDVFGAQEVLYPQLNNMLAALPQYGYVGVGRDDGKTEGEYSPIFYKKDKYDVLKSGQFWLSENTDYPNKGWDAVLPRICTWVELKDKENGMQLWFFNLHMDHVGVEARKESAKLVLSKIKEMCGTDPVIFTGDFNVDQTNESYKVITSSGILNDSYEKAEIKYAQNGTFNAFRIDRKTESRIDHIFVSPSFTIERYGILTEVYWSPIENAETANLGDSPKEISLTQYEARLPSDHYPVKVILYYNQ